VVRAWLDRLYRHPFEGASARRYARLERPAFADLDARILALLAPRLAAARRVVDLGAGPGTFAAAIRAAHPRANVIAVEPSVDFARVASVRARGEALPLASACADLAICLSSIRHCADRSAALRELRRVVRPGGALCIIELDPDASRVRARNHARALGAAYLRAVFTPLVLRTAPPRDEVAGLATAVGWRTMASRLDPVQPVYMLCFE
jgi:demethylmenaquinone methyltransferase/2-methoxy-6-polyprenyl-1,4-benzoquinol methylase